ncbi:MAG: lipopolysaccharide biosynthesis protein RfbH [Eubacteriales bacterium]|nr:lipopolysaccharide biosynthesis protein RfbH [Eubacteriales bacterium]
MTIEEKNDREQILKLVEEYTKKYLIDNKPFKEGDRINYAGRVFDEKEVVNLVDSSLDFWLTEGKYYNAFEEKLSKYLNVKKALFVNSGSSANLLSFFTLTSHLLGDKAIKRGDEIITLACGFSTTVSPILQYGAIPVFVDVDIPSYNIKVEELNKALSKKTKAIIIAHTLGNPFDLNYIKKFCLEHQLFLIEDNCDALGSEYNIEKNLYYAKTIEEYEDLNKKDPSKEKIWVKTGTIGDIATSSFYPAHHITTGEGGAVYTNNDLLYKISKSIRDWGRDCFCKSGVDNTCKNRFSGKYSELPNGYDHKYVYSNFGFNLKATEMQAAIGLAQLDKIDDFTKRRRENFDYFKNACINLHLDEYFYLPNESIDAKSSWFGFLLTIREDKKEEIKRDKIVSYLEKANIQTRNLFSGNLIKHPCFDNIRNDKTKYLIINDLYNTNYIMNNTFWIGMYPKMSKEKLDYMIQKIYESIK